MPPLALPPSPTSKLHRFSCSPFTGFSALLPCFHRITEVKAREDLTWFFSLHNPPRARFYQTLTLRSTTDFPLGVGPEHRVTHDYQVLSYTLEKGIKLGRSKMTVVMFSPSKGAFMPLFGSHSLLRIRNLKFMYSSEHSHDILYLLLICTHTPSQESLREMDGAEDREAEKLQETLACLLHNVTSEGDSMCSSQVHASK